MAAEAKVPPISLKLLLTVRPSIITDTMTTMMTTAKMVAYSVAATAASPDRSLRATRWMSSANWAPIPLTSAPAASSRSYFTKLGCGGFIRFIKGSDSSTWNSKVPSMVTVFPITPP